MLKLNLFVKKRMLDLHSKEMNRKVMNKDKIIPCLLKNIYFLWQAQNYIKKVDDFSMNLIAVFNSLGGN